MGRLVLAAIVFFLNAARLLRTPADGDRLGFELDNILVLLTPALLVVGRPQIVDRAETFRFIGHVRLPCTGRMLTTTASCVQGSRHQENSRLFRISLPARRSCRRSPTAHHP